MNELFIQIMEIILVSIRVVFFSFEKYKVYLPLILLYEFTTKETKRSSVYCYCSLFFTNDSCLLQFFNKSVPYALSLSLSLTLTLYEFSVSTAQTNYVQYTLLFAAACTF